MSLLARIHRHLRRTGIAPTRFGREVVNDPRFVHDLRKGREPGDAITARVTTWLDAREGAS